MIFHPDIYMKRISEDERDLRRLSARCPAIGHRTIRPDLLQVRYRLPGLHRLANGEIVIGGEHLAEFRRPPHYPVLAGPVVRMVTPGVQHWHPNIATTGLVCYGALDPENWAPSLGMDAIAVILARLLRLEIFNLVSVVSGAEEAAHYVRRLAQEGRTPLSRDPLMDASCALNVDITAEGES